MKTRIPLTAAHIERYRDDAYQLKKVRRITYGAALRMVARREGYDSWDALIRDYEACKQAPPAK